MIPFEQALRFGQGIAEFGVGHPMKRATLLEKLELPVNQATKDLITASNKYGITIGSHGAPEFKLTEEGAKAVAPAASLERNRARIKLAITDIEPFKRLYDKFGGGKMPAVEAMRDCLDDMNEGDIVFSPFPHANLTFLTRLSISLYKADKKVAACRLKSVSGSRKLSRELFCHLRLG